MLRQAPDERGNRDVSEAKIPKLPRPAAIRPVDALDARKGVREFFTADDMRSMYLQGRREALEEAAKELPRELMESCLAAASEATFEGFANSVVADKINRLSTVIYRMGFESGWRIREKQVGAAAIRELSKEKE